MPSMTDAEFYDDYGVDDVSKIESVNYACIGCKEMGVLKFRKPGPIGREVAMFKCDECGSTAMLFVKRKWGHVNQRDIAVVRFTPGDKAHPDAKPIYNNPVFID